LKNSVNGELYMHLITCFPVIIGQSCCRGGCKYPVDNSSGFGGPYPQGNDLSTGYYSLISQWSGAQLAIDLEWSVLRSIKHNEVVCLHGV